MAAPPESPAIPLDEEVEGNVECTEDLVFCRLGEAVRLKPGDSAYDLDRPPSHPLEISERHRLLFLAYSKGFLVARTWDVIGLAKEMKENGKNGCVEDVSVVDVEMDGVSLLALSKDCSTLAAIVGAEISFFSVASLLQKEKKPSFLCSLDEFENVKDFKWQKNNEKSFVVLSSLGLLKHGYMEGHLKDVLDNVDAADWSVNGDSIVVARKNNLSILSSNLKVQKQMSLLFCTWSDDADSGFLKKVDSIKWVRDDSIIVGCVCVNEDGKDEGYLVQVIISRERGFTESSSMPVVFSFPELFPDVLDDILPKGCGPYLLTSYMEPWEVALASHKKAVDQHVQLLQWSFNGNAREVVSLENQHEKYTPNIGLKENGDDNTILGFGIDKFSIYENVKVQIGTESSELLPRCIILCLTAEGKLLIFHAARFSDPSGPARPSIPPLDDASGVEEMLSTFRPSKNELSASSLFKNDIESVTSSSLSVSLTGKDLLNLGSSNISELKGDSFTPEKKDQAIVKPISGIPTGQISNLDKSSVQLPCIQGSSSELRSNSKSSVLEVSLTSAKSGLSSTSSDDILGEASASTKTNINVSTKGAEVTKVSVAAANIGGALFGSQTTGKFIPAAGVDANSSPFASSRFLGNSQGNAVGLGNQGNAVGLGNQGHAVGFGNQGSVVGFGNKSSTDNRTPMTFPFSGTSFSLKGATSSPSTSLFSFNKSTQNEGYAASSSKSQNADSMLANRGSVLAHGGSVSGKSIDHRTQQLSENSRTYRSPQALTSEPEFSKQFYDVKDMTKELDSLLSFIEQDGGFRDACTVFQKDSLLALEEGLENLSETSRICKTKLEEMLGDIQQLQNKMLQVSTRQVYMEGIVKQASNRQYWEIWNQQKLNPDLELKRQHLLTLKQNLTTQLIELERHFNALEISKFGESGRSPTDRRTFRNRLEPSSKMQSLQSVYNTLNSQFAAAEQLSERLSNQMAALNINTPSVKQRTVTKELFESIGLGHEADAYQSPNVGSPFRTPVSTKRVPASASSIKEYPRGSTTSALKSSESETTRRRRDSLDKSLANFEPQKTTVKRMSREERISGICNKPFRKVSGAFNSQIEEVSSSQQESNGTQATSSLNLFTNKFLSNACPTNKDSQERLSEQIFGTKLDSLFKSTKDHSASSQALESASLPVQEMQKTTPQPSPPKILSPLSYSNAQNSKRSSLNLPIMSKTGATHFKSWSDSSADKALTSFKTSSNVQSDISTLNQTCLRFPTTILPTIATSPPKTVVQASQQYKKNGEDVQTRSLPTNANNFAVTPNESSLSSQSSSFTISSRAQNGTGALTDRTTDKSESVEAVSPVASHAAVSASGPSLSVPFSAIATSSAISTSAAVPLFPTPSNATAFGGSSISAKIVEETNKTAFVSSSYSTSLSSSSLVLPSFQLQKLPGLPLSASPSESAALRSPPSPANEGNPISVRALSQAPESDGSLNQSAIGSKSEQTSSQAHLTVASGGSGSEKVSSAHPPVTSGIFSAAQSSLEMSSAPVPTLTATSLPKDEGLDLSSSQEDEMDEEAPDTTTVLNLGTLGGFGLGSTPPSNMPKRNPFDGSFVTTTTASASSSITFSYPSGQLFRPASFSLASAQPVQPSQPMGSGPFSSGPGNVSGFGQPAQIAAGQQALGSVLGTFGQSRQLGFGSPGIGFGSPGSSVLGGFSAAANNVGFASSGAATVGGFAALASSSGGFGGVATGGGFAAVASGGGGFAAAAAASSGGGFAAAAASAGGGLSPGGFRAFGSNQGGDFSAFGGSSSTGAGRPPPELLTQMRR